MPRIIAAIVISLIAGFALGAWLKGDEQVGVSAPGVQTGVRDFDSAQSNEDRLVRLEQVIAEERDARLILEDRLLELMEEVERISSTGPPVSAEQQARIDEARESSRRDRAANRDYASMAQRYADRRVERMVKGGFSEDEARNLLKLESEAQYKALEAMYEAQRDGEPLDLFGSMGTADSILRAELGDERYARYLEAQGDPASVQVTQILGGSPASEVGLQSGDRIVGYNGKRVFSMLELRRLTMQGQPGENVIVEIERDGVAMQLSMPRGPLGISGSGANMRGANIWAGG